LVNNFENMDFDKNESKNIKTPPTLFNYLDPMF